MVRLICWTLVRLLFRLRRRGEIPASLPERLVVVANHQSFLDGLLVQAFLPVPLTWVVHSQIAALWYFRLPLRLVPHVLVDAANPLAMKTVIHLIEAGHPVMIFPEGRITVTGSLMKVYDGPAFLVAKTNAKLLPVYIDGAVHSFFTRMRKPFPRKLRPRVTLTFLPLTTIPMPEAPTGKQRRRLASEKMRALLQQMRLTAHPRVTLFEAFLDAISLYGRGARVLEDTRPKVDSYAQVLKGALALGRLVSRFTKEEEITGVLMPNVGTTVALLFGMFATRRIPAMLNYTSGVDGMQGACRTAKIRTIFTSRTFLEKAKIQDKVAQLKDVRVVYLEDLRPMFGLLDKLWLVGWALRFPRAVMRRGSPEDPAVVLFTSGSEGRPKGVVLSHYSIMTNIAQVKAIIEFSNADKFLVALPMFHSFGLTVGMLMPMVSGVHVFLYPSPLHYRMIPEVAYDRDCTVLFGTGTFLANYARTANPYDFYRVRYVISGAEKLADEVRQTWMDKFGIRILEGYGATECAPIISANTPMAHRPGSVGKLLPGMKHRIEPVPGLDRGGVLHVHGPNLMLGYLMPDRPGVLQPPDSTSGERWYNTGDVVEVDADGYLHILGRMKRFAKVAGEMVSLELAEKIAAHVSSKFAHAATAIRHATRGETICLFTEDPSLARDRLLAAARELGYPEVAVPRKVEFVEKLPRLSIGKLDYVAVNSLAQERLQQLLQAGGTA